MDDVLFGLPGGQLDDFLVARSEARAVVAQHQIGELAGQHLVAAHHHVEHGLRADDLAGGRHQRRVPGVLAHSRHLEQHFLELAGRALLLQLALHVGDHAARDLAVEDFGLDASDVGEELGVARADFGEMILDFQQAALVEARFEPRSV